MWCGSACRGIYSVWTCTLIIRLMHSPSSVLALIPFENQSQVIELTFMTSGPQSSSHMRQGGCGPAVLQIPLRPGVLLSNESSLISAGEFAKRVCQDLPKRREYSGCGMPIPSPGTHALHSWNFNCAFGGVWDNLMSPRLWQWRTKEFKIRVERQIVQKWMQLDRSFRGLEARLIKNPLHGGMFVPDHSADASVDFKCVQ